MTALPEGYRHLALGDVGSTNDEALLRARSGETGNLWITAERQSTGKARRGRSWVSELGNLYSSLLLIDPAPTPKLGTLPLVAALAVYRTLRPFFHRVPQTLTIKWPNDLLVDGAKINGILLESGHLADGRLAVVIGCGINCAHHPESTLYQTTDLKSCGIDIAPQALLEALAAEMDATLALWARGAGLPAIREAWLMAAQGVGEAVRVNLGDKTLEGVFVDLDPDGYLLLQDDKAVLHRVSAGDLFFTA